MDIRLIALDMDGTTLQDDHVTLSPRNRAAIDAAIAAGVQVVFATGRMRYRLPEQVECIPGIRYAITSNGAAVNDLQDDSVLYTRGLPPTLFLQVYDQLTPLGIYLEAYYQGNAYVSRANDALWNSFPLPEDRRAMMSRNRILVDDLREFVASEQRMVEKINIPYLSDELHELFWQKARQLEGVMLTSSIAHNAEINADGANKADGLAFLCNHLGILPEQVLAVGDNQNDFEMLQFAGLTAVPENGLEVCRALADLVVPSNNEDGVAQAIEQLVLAKE